MPNFIEKLIDTTPTLRRSLRYSFRYPVLSIDSDRPEESAQLPSPLPQRSLFTIMAAVPPAVVHPHVRKAAGDYTTIATTGLSFLQSSHDSTRAIQCGMNAFYAEEVALDGIFHTDATDRDSIAGDAATNLYKNKIAMVTAQADQTPVPTQGRIANIVRRWRLKFEFTPGKFRNLPQSGQAPSSLITFFTRAVAGAVTDLMIHVQTEDFFIDPNPGAVVTYRNFDHFSATLFVRVAVGGAAGVVAPPAFYFNLAAAPAPVRARYERRRNGSQYVRDSDLLPFDDTGVDMNYYVDAVNGEYFILRDGTLLEIKPQNEMRSAYSLSRRSVWIHLAQDSVIGMTYS
jgi:hypothetical protein